MNEDRAEDRTGDAVIRSVSVPSGLALCGVRACWTLRGFSRARGGECLTDFLKKGLARVRQGPQGHFPRSGSGSG